MPRPTIAPAHLTLASPRLPIGGDDQEDDHQEDNQRAEDRVGPERVFGRLLADRGTF